MSEAELAALIDSLNADERVHGILLQLPLPAQLDQAVLVPRIAAAKDVDGLTPMNAGLLFQDQLGAMVPCTPAGVMELLAEAGVNRGRPRRGGGTLHPRRQAPHPAAPGT